MSIDSWIEGSPGEIRAAGTWAGGRLQSSLTAAVDALGGAAGAAQGGWTGAAGTAFMTRISTCRTSTQSVADKADVVGRSLDKYAAALETAQEAMKKVRTHASAAELTVTETTIEDPGTGPGKPWREGELDAQQEARFEKLSADYDAHQKKVSAYQQARSEASAIDEALETAKTLLTNASSELTGKWHINAADFVTSSAGAYYKIGESILRGQADFLRDNAARHLSHYLNSPGGSEQSKYHNQKILESQLGAADEDAKALKLGKILSKLDKAGPVLAVAGVGYDIHEGKEPGKAIVSGAVGFGAAALIVSTAPVSVPALAVGAAAVGVGILGGMAGDYAWDHFVPDDAKDKIDDGLDYVGGKAKDVGKDIGGGVKDAWNSVS